MMVDAQLTDLALAALEQNPHLPRHNLHLHAASGRITLRGVVRSFYQKQMAQESLRRLEGVSEIENHLEVDWR
jgi:osmotically-inducible protein OsmY